MDIPRILADFGREVGESLLDSRIQTVKLSPKYEKKTKLCAFMDLDLDGQCIRFTPTDYMRGISEKRYNYLGNNKAAASQIYIVREVAGFQNFWSGRPRGVMQNLLEFLPEGQLKQTLHSCAHAGFWNDQGLNVSLFQKDGEFLKDLVYRSGEKAFYVGEDKISLERLLSDILEIPAGSKLILIIPRVILNSETLVISQHDEYIRAIASSLGGTNEGAEGVCHICGQNRKDVNTIEYSAKFSRSNVGKIFVTTQVNYASGLRKAAHQQNFGICKSCYEAFMAGEKVVEERFRIRVAKQTALVLFEGVIQPVTMSMVEPFKNHIDAAFNPKDTQEWIDNFRSEVQDSENQNVELFQFHIIFYQTDGKSYKVLKTIEDISRKPD